MLPEHDCNHEADWLETKRILADISRHFKENGEFSLPTKVRLLWQDRVSRNRFAGDIGTWIFRVILIYLIWGKIPKP